MIFFFFKSLAEFASKFRTWRIEEQEVSPLEEALLPGGTIESERKLPGGFPSLLLPPHSVLRNFSLVVRMSLRSVSV